MKRIIESLSVKESMEIVDYGVSKLSKSKNGVIITFPTNFSSISIFLLKNNTMVINRKKYSNIDKEAIKNILSKENFIGRYETINGYVDIK